MDHIYTPYSVIIIEGMNGIKSEDSQQENCWKGSDYVTNCEQL